MRQQVKSCGFYSKTVTEIISPVFVCWETCYAPWSLNIFCWCEFLIIFFFDSQMLAFREKKIHRQFGCWQRKGGLFLFYNFTKKNSKLRRNWIQNKTKSTTDTTDTNTTLGIFSLPEICSLKEVGLSFICMNRWYRDIFYTTFFPEKILEMKMKEKYTRIHPPPPKKPQKKPKNQAQSQKKQVKTTVSKQQKLPLENHCTG